MAECAVGEGRCIFIYSTYNNVYIYIYTYIYLIHTVYYYNVLYYTVLILYYITLYSVMLYDMNYIVTYDSIPFLWLLML